MLALKYDRSTHRLPQAREYDTTGSSWNNYNYQIFNQSAKPKIIVMDYVQSADYRFHIQAQGMKENWP